MESTLVLNASYEPLGIVNARSALTKIMNGKAIALENSDKVFRAGEDTYPVPYVVRLNYMVKRKKHKALGFSKRGVFIRDDYTCAYCGKFGNTIDHIIPRAHGGENSYENCVTACHKCNSKKADSTLEQLGWTAPKMDGVVNIYTLMLHRVRSKGEVYSSWEQYLTPYLKMRV